MGLDPATSVTDAWGSVNGISNLVGGCRVRPILNHWRRQSDDHPNGAGIAISYQMLESWGDYAS